jgi:hypothetical protein
MVMGLGLVVMLALSLVITLIPARAAGLCGEGSAPDYGFSYDLQQPHWTVGWQDTASELAVNEVDAILDRLNGDSIAQTMILIQPQAQVGNRVNCAVHFLRYMKLGNPSGERKDNGFVFLIVDEATRIDVHYGVGLGLPALTAADLTSLNRAAEDAYLVNHNMDDALLSLVKSYDMLARAKYSALPSPTTATDTNTQPALPAGPLGIFAICGQLCLGIIVLLFLLWAARNGIRFNTSGFGSGGMGFPRGRGGSSTRGGSGSGRSGRGN